MEEEKDNKGKKIIDKVVMGAVIGGAIGSVLGATIAPKKGKETREEIKGAAKSAKKNSGILFSKVKKLFGFKKKEQEENVVKQIPNEK